MKLHILYSVSDTQDGFDRPLNMTKQQVIGCSFNSLIKSIESFEQTITLTVFENGLKQETKDFIEETANKANIKQNYSMIFDKNHTKKALSLFAENKSAYDEKEDWFYFCEDDYLHDYLNFFPRFLDFVALVKMRNFALPCFFSPSDNVAAYGEDAHRSYILAGVTGYIREINFCPNTFLCSAQTYRKFSNRILGSADNGFRFSRIFFREDALCFCPLPGIATKMIKNRMDKFVNWTDIIYQKV